MVLISLQEPDPTLEALKKVCFLEQFKHNPRDYLGASLIGQECERAIWYSYHNYVGEPFTVETLWNFEDGHRTEDLIAERLRKIEGIELWTHDEEGKQFGFSMFDDKFKGHVDGIIRGLIQSPKTVHVWECKACADKKYNSFLSIKNSYTEKEILEQWDKGYYAQAQVYMHTLGLTRHYLTVARAGGRDITSCRTEYNKDVAISYLEKAERIIGSKSYPARISSKPDFFICRFCRYKGICRDD